MQTADPEMSHSGERDRTAQVQTAENGRWGSVNICR